MTNWPTQPYDIVAAGKELGLSPKREAAQWCKISACPKDSPSEAGITASAQMPRRERLQEQLEREARESREPKPEAIADKLIEKVEKDIGVWIAWGGGEMPIPRGTKCEILLEDGDQFESENTVLYWGREDKNWIPIIAYRVIQPKQEGR